MVASSRRRPPSIALIAVTLVALLVAPVACGSTGDDDPAAQVPTAPSMPPPDSIVEGDPAPGVEAAADELFADPLGPPPTAALETLGTSDDLRFAWHLADRLRYESSGEAGQGLVDGLADLTGVTPPTATVDVWTYYVDLLLAWDVPPPPGYLARKRALHLAHDPAAAAFFDEAATVDWRLIGPAGVGRDDLVPLDAPEVVEAGTDVTWLADDEPVFGVNVAGEWRAYPRRVLRAHELVNDTVGERRLLVSYCEACGGATAWYLDGHRTGGSATAGAGRPPLDLSSSGLVLSGAPLAYDETTMSLVDTFAGRALTGPLGQDGVELSPVTVVASTWSDWVEAHESATVVAEDGGVGRIYLDESGPPTTMVWPVGPRDERLAGDEVVLGVHLADGSKVAFPVDDARRALDDDGELSWRGVVVTLDAGGLRARAAEDARSSSTSTTAPATGPPEARPVASHEATWRAWSHFHPDSPLWQPDD